MKVKCLTCSNEFKTFKSRVRIGKGKYCSQQKRLDVSNGRTLCFSCHATTDTFKGKAKIWQK